MINPMALDRSKTQAPSKDSYSPYGNAPYWPTKETPKQVIPAELNPDQKGAKAEAIPAEMGKKAEAAPAEGAKKAEEAKDAAPA